MALVPAQGRINWGRCMTTALTQAMINLVALGVE